MTGDTLNLDPVFRQELESMEYVTGIRFHVTSGKRTPEHNSDPKVGGVKNSAHTEDPCVAADIDCQVSWHRYVILKEAISRGFKRIGIGKTFIHLDRSTTLPQAVCWHYYPKEKQ